MFNFFNYIFNTILTFLYKKVEKVEKVAIKKHKINKKRKIHIKIEPQDFYLDIYLANDYIESDYINNYDGIIV